MRYKLAGVVVFMLVTPLVYAQEISPLVVKTHYDTYPAVVRTGELITQTYTIEFLDLTSQGQEIVVEEESFNVGMLDVFKVVNLEVDKHVKSRLFDVRIDGQTQKREFVVHVWNLAYTLYVVNPNKVSYEIPAFTIVWRQKDIGQDINDPGIAINTHVKTSPVDVDYVTSIPVRSPFIDIKDRINIGDYSGLGYYLGLISWVFIAIPIAFGTLLVVRRLRRSEPARVKGDLIVVEEEGNINDIEILSPRLATSNLKKAISESETMLLYRHNKTDELLKIETKLLSAIMDFLRSMIPGLYIGSMPSDIKAYISDHLSEGSSKEALSHLASRAAVYQQDIEKGIPTKVFQNNVENNVVLEMRRLKKDLKKIKWRSKAIYKVKRLFKRLPLWSRLIRGESDA